MRLEASGRGGERWVGPAEPTGNGGRPGVWGRGAGRKGSELGLPLVSFYGHSHLPGRGFVLRPHCPWAVGHTAQQRGQVCSELMSLGSEKAS